MNVIVKGRHMHVTPALQGYAEEKVTKVGRILNSQLKSAEVELYVEKNPSIENNQVAEVTMWTKGPVIRAREAAPDMYAAIDMVSDKLENQVRRYKGKFHDKHSRKAAVPPVPAPLPTVEDLVEEDRTVVKTKDLTVKPMTQEEAILQLELLGHDFFVFTCAETEEINVLYRRNDGDYGLIRPSMA
jgi:putative sigma-54 modulation protein